LHLKLHHDQELEWNIGRQQLCPRKTSKFEFAQEITHYISNELHKSLAFNSTGRVFNATNKLHRGSPSTQPGSFKLPIISQKEAQEMLRDTSKL
jgi:hypothetical protein